MTGTRKEIGIKADVPGGGARAAVSILDIAKRGRVCYDSNPLQPLHARRGIAVLAGRAGIAGTCRRGPEQR